jgi:hypothetical protein
MIRILSTFLLLALCNNLFSQSENIKSRLEYYEENKKNITKFINDNWNPWEKGYVIKNNGDTIYGEIQKQVQGQYDLGILKVVVKNEEIGKKKFRADKALGFKKGDKFYDSRKIEDKPPAYYRKFVDGKIIIYGDEKGNNKNIFLLNLSKSLYLFNTSNNKSIILTRYNFSDRLKYLIEDDKELVEYMEKNNLGYDDWFSVIAVYNER